MFIYKYTNYFAIIKIVGGTTLFCICLLFFIGLISYIVTAPCTKLIRHRRGIQQEDNLDTTYSTVVLEL